MIYFAHRGASTQRVQNTLPAFALAQAQGARCYELDVHLLKDGALAIHHDYVLATTPGNKNPLAQLTKDDLKKYPLANPFTEQSVYVPLLQEVLTLLAQKVELLNIEIKNDDNIYPGIEEAVLKQVAKFPDLLPRILFSSFDYPSLQRLRRLAPTARIGWLTRQFCLEQALAVRAQSVHIRDTRFTREIAQICKSNGLQVYVYTVNDPAQARQLEQAGADGIFTDCVHLFI
ncbi:MAG: hypothetical protein IKO35_05720 [Elusimicrobiaceae bacterium]|nr:hypothetical protein [Elusimicrobiaceae bacterium]